MTNETVISSASNFMVLCLNALLGPFETRKYEIHMARRLESKKENKRLGLKVFWDEQGISITGNKLLYNLLSSNR